MSNFLSLIGWTVLPGLVTSWTQTIYYGITIRAGDPKPQPGTPRYAEHYRRIYIIVVSLYLFYNIYEADWDLQRQGDFYSDLGVGLDASDKDVKSRFRRLAAVYHPDKVSTTGGSSAGAAGTATGILGAGLGPEAYFIRLKTASETLQDPTKRFAYDRFGPEIISWQNCKTIRDYISVGTSSIIPYYGGAAMVLYGLPWLGYLTWGKYWRWLVFAAVLLFELKTVTRPNHPALFTNLVNPALRLFSSTTTRTTGHPPYLPFQAVALMRKLSVTFSIALGQVGPYLLADTKSGKVAFQEDQGAALAGGGNHDAALAQGVERLRASAAALDADAARLMDLELVPYAASPELLANLRGKMKEWLVQNTIRSDPMVKDAVGNSVRRRRVDAPAGARGNR